MPHRDGGGTLPRPQRLVFFCREMNREGCVTTTRHRASSTRGQLAICLILCVFARGILGGDRRPQPRRHEHRWPIRALSTDGIHHSISGERTMRLDPTTRFLIVLVIGFAAGLIFDRVARPAWLSRQIAGSTRTMVTSVLVGIAGSFIGFDLAEVFRIAAGGYGSLIGAAVGAIVVLWAWRMIR